MAYVPFSLRYRPQSFAEIVGQEHVSRTLQNAVASGRVVHGYLFAGPRGTGKTSTARVLAKALLCEHGPTPTPCGECSLCRAISAGRALDVIEIDAASNRGIEQIRELREKVRYSPAEARYKVYILDEVHMLTPEAFNALLKTLEEPPEHTFFVLATTELHRVPPTIVSRCQLFEFHLIPEGHIERALSAIAEREGVEVEEAALEELARAARGALRDAESIFDQVVAYSEGAITAQIVREVLGSTPREAVSGLMRAMAANDLAEVLGQLDDLVADGKDLPQLMQDVMLATREMLRSSLGVAAGGEWPDVQEVAKGLGSEKLADALRSLGEAEKRLRDATQQQLSVELALAEITQLWAEPSAKDRARAAAARNSADRSSAGGGRQSRGRAVSSSRQAPASRRDQPGEDEAAPEDRQATERPARQRPTRLRPDGPAKALEEAPEPAGPSPARAPAGQAGAPAQGKPSASGAELPPLDEAEQAALAQEGGEPPQAKQQRPAQPPDVDGAAAGGGEDLASRWQAVHLELKRRKRAALWALLRDGEPRGVVGDEAIIGFPTDRKFHYDRVDGPYREDVEEALSAVLGRPIKLRCVLGDGTGRAGSGASAGARARRASRSAGGAGEDRTGRGERPLMEREDDSEAGGSGSGAKTTDEPAEDAAGRAANLALDIFPDSQELPPE